nr:flagellar hook-length control protein FliK [Sporosarcina sp. E16_8]
MQTIFKRSNFGQTGGTNRLLIKLYPEHLGQVRIELLQVNGIMTARILASTALGKEMLDSQLHQLRSAFLQQNLQVERIDVSQTLQDSTKNDRDQAFNQHFRKEGQEADEQQEQTDEEEMTFQEYMIDLGV